MFSKGQSYVFIIKWKKKDQKLLIKKLVNLIFIFNIIFLPKSIGYFIFRHHRIVFNLKNITYYLDNLFVTTNIRFFERYETYDWKSKHCIYVNIEQFK